MLKIRFERLMTRGVANLFESELMLAGMKMDVYGLLKILVVGSVALFVSVPFLLAIVFKIDVRIAAVSAFVAAALFEIAVYAILEFKIEQRKSFMEDLLPDYLQLVAANVRSGIALDKSMFLAARPEFGYFSEDVKQMNKELYGGVTLQMALSNLSRKYRSLQLQHTIRMMREGIQYGGGMTDLLNQIAKDIRSQHLVQKEVSGQLFMYTVFIAFAALLGAPVLYALTSQMITVTDTVWAGILKQNAGGLPTAGVSFLRPSPPKITIEAYHNFSIAAVATISGFGAFIVSTIAIGSTLKGLRFLPIFLIVALGVFFLVSSLIGGIFTSISGI